MISLLFTLTLIGVVLWIVNTYVPMAAPIKNIINIVVAIFAVLITLQAFGVISQWPGWVRVR